MVTDLSRGRNNPNSSPSLALAKAQDVCPRNTLIGGGCDLRCDTQDDYRCADFVLSQKLCPAPQVLAVRHCLPSMDMLSLSSERILCRTVCHTATVACRLHESIMSIVMLLQACNCRMRQRTAPVGL
jgi:hypothetical protein